MIVTDDLAVRHDFDERQRVLAQHLARDLARGRRAGAAERRAGVLAVRGRQQHRAGRDEAPPRRQPGQPLLVGKPVGQADVHAAEPDRHRVYPVGRAGRGHQAKAGVQQRVVHAQRVAEPLPLAARAVRPRGG